LERVWAGAKPGLSPRILPAPSDRVKISARRSTPKIQVHFVPRSRSDFHRTDIAPSRMTETAESCHSRENIEARPCQFSADSRQKFNVVEVGCLSSPFLRMPSPPLAAHWADNEPIFRSEIKNRASVSTFPFPPLSRF
jgi:hypothetical protein